MFKIITHYIGHFFTITKSLKLLYPLFNLKICAFFPLNRDIEWYQFIFSTDVGTAGMNQNNSMNIIDMHTTYEIMNTVKK